MVLLDKLALHAPHLSSKQIIPAFVYGTAWKKDATTELVVQALSNGFTGIDTACQPKHYREDLVGEALRKAITQNRIKRADIYVQTKYTSLGGHDPSKIPYDPKKTLAEQVRQSIEVSLSHLDTSKAGDSESANNYLDTLVLHSPMRNINDTMEVWRTVETYVPQKIHNIGISNCDLFTLMDVYERARIKPAVVQNRFYPQTKFDIGVRKFCREKNIVYQSFWTLSANPELLRSKPVRDLAAQLNITRECSLYCLVLGLGNMVVLNGTTGIQHMRDDWAALSAAQEFASSNKAAWQSALNSFKSLIGQPATE